jgi:hypothetical protein
LPLRFQHCALGCGSAFGTVLLVAAALSAPCFWLRQRFQHCALGCGSASALCFWVPQRFQHRTIGCGSAFSAAVSVAAALSAQCFWVAQRFSAAIKVGPMLPGL